MCNSSSLFQTSLFNSVNNQVFFDCMSPICLNGTPHALWHPTCLTAPHLPYWRPKSMCGPHHHPLIPRCAFVAISASSAPQSMCGSHHLIPIPSDVHILIPMTKDQDKRSQFHHHCHHPTFFYNKKNHRQPKGTLVLQAKVKYIRAHPLL